VPGGNLFGATAYAIPDFAGGDRPSPPLAPVGDLRNAVPADRAGTARAATSPAGAYTGDAPPADPTVQFDAASYSVTESAGAATIRVTRSSGDGAVSVRYATRAGSATAGSDYTEASGQLNFAAGATAATFTVAIANDAATESTETISLSLSAPSGVVLGSRNTATLSIVDDDVPGAIAGRVFDDRNGNGRLDAGERGRRNTVFIDANGNGSLDGGERSMTSASDGRYMFADVSAGAHTIAAVPRTGWLSGSARAVVSSSATTPDVDVPIYRPTRVTGTVFRDANRNGRRDGSEARLAGWTIYVDANRNGAFDAGESSAVSNSTGRYTLFGVRPGAVQVRQVVQAGWTQIAPPTAAIDLVLSSGGLGRADFGNDLIGV
jgi:hypothetical protein